MRLDTCGECRRLMEEYRATLMECIRINGKLQVARLSNNVEAMDAGSDALMEASRRRVKAKAEIRDHEKVSHPEDTPLSLQDENS
ncbi:MAG: hypothetical protein U0Q18_33825 [Bryobacteraceae bacterium]